MRLVSTTIRIATYCKKEGGLIEYRLQMCFLIQKCHPISLRSELRIEVLTSPGQKGRCLFLRSLLGRRFKSKSDDIRGHIQQKTLNIWEQSRCLFAECTCVFKNAVKWGTPETMAVKHTHVHDTPSLRVNPARSECFLSWEIRDLQGGLMRYGMKGSDITFSTQDLQAESNLVLREGHSKTAGLGTQM